VDEQKKDWIGEGIPLDRPNSARIYDYLLGGNHNFAADRAAAEKLKKSLPDVVEGAAVQRAFLRRVIDFFTAEGIDQFLDIGSGLPTVGNVHDLARATIPEAKVVYVDIDPVVIAHSSRILKDVPDVTIIEGDLRRPSKILNHEEVRHLLDFERPLGLTMTAVLHFIVDDEVAYRSVGTLVDAIASGSCVAMTHTLIEAKSRENVERATDDYKEAASAKARPREDIARFFDGLQLLEPGLVRAPVWRPESPDDLLLDNPEAYLGLAGVGRKP
jgi:O-methyltransferase involved in polyketide biosynthesis